MIRHYCTVKEREVSLLKTPTTDFGALTVGRSKRWQNELRGRINQARIAVSVAPKTSGHARPSFARVGSAGPSERT